MSGGEFIPNGSVHWDIEEDEVTKDADGNIDRKTGRKLHGRDPIDAADIGKGKKVGDDHDGVLRVILRFKEQGQVRPALEAGIKSVQFNPKSELWEVQIAVPVSPAEPNQANEPTPNPFAQARVEW